MEKNITMPELKKYYVAYFDILGYKQFFKEHPHDAHILLKKVYHTISETITNIDAINYLITKLGGTSDLFSYKTFSDNIVIYYTYDDPHTSNYLLHSFIEMIKGIQINLWRHHNTFIRGGITTGEFAANETFVFGKALIRAVTLEESIADAPIIIIDDCIIKELNTHATTGSFATTQTLKELDENINGIFTDNKPETLHHRIQKALTIYDDIIFSTLETPYFNNQQYLITMKNAFINCQSLSREALNLYPNKLEELYSIVKQAHPTLITLAQHCINERNTTINKFNDLRYLDNIIEFESKFFIDYLTIPKYDEMLPVFGKQMDSILTNLQSLLSDDTDILDEITSNLNGSCKTQLIDNIAIHKEAVEYNLNKYIGNDRVYPKYEFLKRYHNEICKDNYPELQIK